jgi:hypothetical protein
MFAPGQQAQSKEPRLSMAPMACVNIHAFSGVLRKWEEGVPWAWETVQAAVEKGAHKSATSEESIKLVQQEEGGLFRSPHLERPSKTVTKAIENLPTCCRTARKPPGTHDSGSVVRCTRSQNNRKGAPRTRCTGTR